MTATFRINQDGVLGAWNTARQDIAPFSVSGSVTLEASAANSYSWELTSAPEGHVGVIVDPTNQVATLDVEVTGGYLVRLTIDTGLPTESSRELYLGIPLEYSGLCIPAFNETVQDNSDGSSYYGYERKLTAILKWADQLGASGSTDDKVKIDNADSASGFLEDKLVAGSNITLNKVDVGGLKHLEVSATGDLNDKVKVDAADTTEQYLEDKIQAGANITITNVDVAGVKHLEIAATGGALTDEKVKVSASDTTEGYLDGKIFTGDGIRTRILNAASDEDLLVDTVNAAGIYLEKHDVRVAAEGSPWLPVAASYDSVDNSITAGSDGELNTLGGIDGITDWAVGDRLVHTLGYTGAYYGLYEIADLGSPTSRFKLVRPKDFDGPDNVLSGCYVYVKEGTHAGKTYTLSTAGKITLGVTSQTWDRYYGTVVNENTVVVQKGGSAVVNGENLLGAISMATSLTPYGLLPSSKNRVVVRVPAGEYDLGSSGSAFLTLSSAHNYMTIRGEGDAWSKNEHDCPVVEDIVHPLTWIHGSNNNGSYGLVRIQDDLVDFSLENVALSNSYVGAPVFGYHNLAKDVRFKSCTFRVPELSVSISGISIGSVTTVTTAVSHGIYSDGQIVRLEGITGTTELNGRYFRVANAVGSQFDLRSVNDWTDDIDSTAYTAYVSGGSVKWHSPEAQGVSAPFTAAIVGYNTGTAPTFHGSFNNCHIEGSFYFQGSPSESYFSGSILNSTFIGALYDSSIIGGHIENCLVQGFGVACRGGAAIDADSVIRDVITWQKFISSGASCHGLLENVWVKYGGFQLSGAPSTGKLINCRADNWYASEPANWGDGSVIEGGFFGTTSPSPRFYIFGFVTMVGVVVEKGKNDVQWIDGSGGTLYIRDCSIRDGVAYGNSVVIVNGDGGDCARYPVKTAKEITVEVTTDALVNGENLYDAYQYAQTMTPGGASMSPNNRLIFRIPAGVYNMDNVGKKTVTVGSSYMDIVGSGVARWKNIVPDELPKIGSLDLYTCPETKILSAASSNDVSFYFPVSYVSVRGLWFVSSYNISGSNYGPAIQVEGDYCVFEDCLFSSDGYFSNTTPPILTVGGMSETWIDCHAIGQSFISSGGIQTCVRCTGGAHSFGNNSGGAVVGRYVDCKAVNSFGCELSGNAEAEFLRCYSNGKCFGNKGFKGKAHDCRVLDADSEPFGGATGGFNAELRRCYVQDLGVPIGTEGTGVQGFGGTIDDCIFESGDSTIPMVVVGQSNLANNVGLRMRNTVFNHLPNYGVLSVVVGNPTYATVDVMGCTMPGGLDTDLFNYNSNPRNDAPVHGNSRLIEFVGKANTVNGVGNVSGLLDRFLQIPTFIDDSVYVGSGVISVNQPSSTECAAFKVDFCVNVNSGVAAVVGSPVVTLLAQSGLSGITTASVAITIVSSVRLYVQVTGNDTTLNWQGVITMACASNNSLQ